MKILLKNITEKIMEYENEVLCSGIDNNGDDIKFPNNIKFIGTLRKGIDFVEISGGVCADFITTCHLCGEEAKGKIEFEIFETYRREPGEEEYALIGDEVEFDDMIFENLRLNLPIKFLCNENCKGVCTSCGKNLNNGECDCTREKEEDSPFNVLKKLLD